MRVFAIGLILGLILGCAATACAAALVGANGYLHGWSVTKEGEEVCTDPYVRVGENKIECE